LAQDVGCDEIRQRGLARVAVSRKASRRGQAPTTLHARHSEGNYQSYIEHLKKRKGADADQPHRIAYKKLVRA
jgi:hypothetical protein